MSERENGAWNTCMIATKTPDGWFGTVDDQNELFTHILTRYLWLRVGHTIPVCNVTLEKWRRYAPTYMQTYWTNIMKIYRECIDCFGKTCSYLAHYEPIMAIYEWDALHAVAVGQTRYLDVVQKPLVQGARMSRGITLDYRWDELRGVAVMCVAPTDHSVQMHLTAGRYECVDRVIDYAFILDEEKQ